MALRPQGLLCVCAVTADHIKNVCWVGPLCLCAGQKDVTGTWVTSHINSELNILHLHLCLLFTHYKLLGCSIIYGYLHVGNSVADMIGNAMEKKEKNQPPKQMYRILNRARERPQMDWKTLHMWFVNMIYTLVSPSSLLLAAPGEERAVPREGSRQSGGCQQRSWVSSGCSWLPRLFCCTSPTVLSREWQRKGWWREGWMWFTVFALEKERNGWACKFPCCCLYWISDDIQQIYVRASRASKTADMWPYNTLLYQSLCIYLHQSSKKCMN